MTCQRLINYMDSKTILSSVNANKLIYNILFWIIGGECVISLQCGYPTSFQKQKNK